MTPPPLVTSPSTLANDLSLIASSVQQPPANLGDPTFADVASLVTIIALFFSIAVAVGAVFMKQLQDRVQNDLDSIRDVWHSLWLAKYGVLSIVSSEIIISASRQSYPSRISKTLELLDDHLKRMQRDRREGDSSRAIDLARLRYVEGVAALVLGRRLVLGLLQTNGATHLDNGFEEDVARLKLVYYRHTDLREGRGSCVEWMRHYAMNHARRESTLTDLVVATGLVSLAKQRGAAAAQSRSPSQLEETAEDLELAARLLKGRDEEILNGHSPLPAVDAYRLKVHELQCLLAEVKKDIVRQPKDNAAGDLQITLEAVAYFWNYFLRFLEEQDPAIKANYSFVLAMTCELVAYRSRRCLGELEQIDDHFVELRVSEDIVRASSLAERFKIGPPCGTGGEDVDLKDFGRADRWAAAGWWLAGQAKRCAAQVEDAEFHLLDEFTERLVRQRDFVDHTDRLQHACLSSFRLGPGPLNNSQEEHRHIDPLHQRLWLPERSVWMETERKVSGYSSISNEVE